MLQTRFWHPFLEQILSKPPFCSYVQMALLGGYPIPSPLSWQTTRHTNAARPTYSRRACVREMPPGLLQHVLAVLVFWSWALLLPQLPPSSRSLKLFPCANILLHAPLDICLDLLPAAPPPPVQNRTHSTCFYSTGGHTPNVRVYHDIFGLQGMLAFAPRFFKN